MSVISDSGRDFLDLSGSPDESDVSELRSSGGHNVISDGSVLSKEEISRLTDDIVDSIKTVYDPEIPVDIYELGLIYRIDVDDSRNVSVEMTLTAPGCPVAGDMPIWVRDAVRSVSGIGDVSVHLVFDPPWDPSRMSDEARMALNMW